MTFIVEKVLDLDVRDLGLRHVLLLGIVVNEPGWKSALPCHTVIFLALRTEPWQGTGSIFLRPLLIFHHLLLIIVAIRFLLGGHSQL